MTENKKSESQKTGGINGEQTALSATHPMDRTTDRSGHESSANATNNNHQQNQHNSYNFLSRLSLNEFLTLFVGVASLVVSYFTYRNATDTSDLKAAVGNLTKLAGEAHVQAVAMQAQALAMQGQLEEAVVSQRPWITITPTVVSFNMSEFVISKSRSVTMALNFALYNAGREPANKIQIQWEVIPYIGNPRTVRDIDAVQEVKCSDAKRITELPNVKNTTILPATEENEIQSTGIHNRDIGNQSLFLVYGCVDYSYWTNRHGQNLFRYVLGKQNAERPGMIKFQADTPFGITTNTSLEPSELELRKDIFGRNEIR